MGRVAIAYASSTRAPFARAKSTAAAASAPLIPCLRYPARIAKQVTAQTVSSVRSSFRPVHGTRVLSRRG